MPLKENFKANLIKRIEENSLLFWGQLDVELYFFSHHTLLISGIPHPLFNGVIRSLTPIIPSDLVEKTLAEFRWRKLPFTWWVDSKVNPSGFGKVLESNGFTVLEAFAGMALEVSHLNIQKQKDKNLTIDPVTGSNLMADWREILQYYFDLDESIRNTYVDMFLNRVLATTPPFRHFLALYNGVPAGGATLFIHEDIGGIYNLSVSPEFREQGVATALVEKLIESAKLCGCKFVVVTTPQKTHGVFHSLGFQKLCQLDSYVWPSAKPNIHINPYTTNRGTEQ